VIPWSCKGVSEDSRQPDPSRVTVSTSDTVAPERRLFGYLLRQFSGTMVSRVLGFARELVTSFYFGASAAADAFIAALTIPTLFRDILGEDVVDRAVMPGVRERLARGEHQQAWLFSSAALTWMILGMTATMALVYLTAPWLVQVVAGGIHQRTVDEGTVADVINMTRILVPFIMFIALAAFVGGLLYYCYDLHLPYSLAPAMLSVGVIASLVFFTEKYGVYALAIGFVGGAALQLLVQVPFLRSRTVRETQPRYIPILRFPDGSGKRVARETGYIALQSVLTKTTEVVDRRVASFLAAGGISSLYFAARLIQLPIGIIGNGISRSVAPYLSERVGLDDRPGFKHAVLIG
jgi:putative peptidoglycan lipid II flippase